MAFFVEKEKIMNKNQETMKTKPILNLLISMSIPMMFSMLIQSLYNIVDSIFVARLGTEALTAVSLVYPLQNIIMSVSVGVGVGLASVISMYLGRQEPEKASRAAVTGLVLNTIHCVIFVFGGIFLTRPFLSLFTGDEQTLSWACQYSYIVLCFSCGSLYQITLEKIYQATGAMITTMISLSVGCIVNTILDPILIFGYFGAPAMGVAGAAIATVIGQFASLFCYIIAYKRRPIGVELSRKHLCWDFQMVKKIYGVGIPSAIMLGLPSVLVGMLNSMLAAFSDMYVAVLGLYLKLQTFIYMPANGLIQGMRPIIGFNYGAGETKRVLKTIRYSLVLIGVIMVLGTAVSWCFPYPILSLFDIKGEMLEKGAQALGIISVGFLVSTLSIVFCGTFEALGRGKESLAVSLIRQFFVIIVLGYGLSKSMGPTGIWVSYPVAELFGALLAVVLYKKTKKRMLSETQ